MKKFLITIFLGFIILWPVKSLGAQIEPPSLVQVKVDGVLQDLKNLKVDQEKTLFLEGTAQPNSEVYLYIYSSSPLLAKTSVDDKGNWQYNLTQQLSVGEHRITGENHVGEDISANVEFLKFKVTRGTVPVVSEISDTAIVGILIALAVILIIVWAIIRRKKK